MALAALSAAAVLDVGSAMAEAAPSVSPFAGTYAGPVPNTTISSGGQFSGADDDGQTQMSIKGRVSADGRYSYNVTVIIFDLRRHRVSQFSDQHAGNMALDPDGNIVGTEDTGVSFIWIRR
jgi:hypothetical protein